MGQKIDMKQVSCVQLRKIEHIDDDFVTKKYVSVNPWLCQEAATCVEVHDQQAFCMSISSLHATRPSADTSRREKRRRRSQSHHAARWRAMFTNAPLHEQHRFALH